MSYLSGAFFAQHDCYYIETKGAVLDVVDGKKIACRAEHSGFFGFGDGRFGRAKIFGRPCLYFNKDKSPVTIYHNKIDFAGLAGEVASECFETFAFEEFLAAFFTPSAEQLLVCQQPVFVRQQFSYQLFRVNLAILRQCGRCAAGRA